MLSVVIFWYGPVKPWREQAGSTVAAMASSPVTVLSLTGDGCADLASEAERYVAERHRAVVLDLEGVRYLTSLQIASVISFRQSLHAAGGTVILANIDPALRAVFRVLKIDRIFALDHDRAGAIAAAGQ